MRSKVMHYLSKLFSSNRKYSFCDELTGLGNIKYFHESLALHASSNKDADKLSVILINIDGFKDINNCYGYSAGNEILLEISKRIQSAINYCIHESIDEFISYNLCRVSGDEFSIAINGYDKSSFITSVMRKVSSGFKEPVATKSETLVISASIGAAEYSTQAQSKQELIKFSDMAMCNAKSSGSNQYRWFSREMETESIEKSVMISKIKKAIQENEFSLSYQPKVNCKEGGTELKEAEALIRWKTKSGEQISPAEFIPFAEKNGLSNDIGKWVFEQLCKDIKGLEDNNISNIKFSFNVSPNQLKDEVFRLFIEKMILKYKVNPNKLQMEITEHCIAEDISKTKETLLKIKKLGIEISLDDFGTEYSSLQFLSELPIDIIKIDRIFVSGCHENRKRGAIINAIVALANGLGMQSVAEGVESIQEAKFIIKSGCTQIQGFYYHKPMPLKEFVTATQ
ncbi:bifunctional diguanylate cyclase/phosphodiesterase [Psychromonas sp. SP041]|uniref:putative bifunctional diguanylate cyclase/phosphodiesterase n=1 Tax=Psychromonas sp. SP041 TaxID=1365007 RepID=UPI0004182E24|nr:bifunctional diguanylate cyclase/phosphodiesterase [Psychromonas sp. SP041]